MINELYLNDDDLALYMRSWAFRDMCKSITKVDTTNRIIFNEWVTANLLVEVSKLVWCYLYVKE
jgi:hypothetical protein